MKRFTRLLLVIIQCVLVSGIYAQSLTINTMSVTGNATGNYSVAVTNANNLSATSAVVSVVVNALPIVTITAGSATTFCAGGSVVLTASAGSSYLWSNGAVTQSITVNASGNYSVTVTDATNYSATSEATVVTVNPLPTAAITAGGATTFCTGGSVILTSSSATGNVWNTGETTRSIKVSTTGDYSVTATAAGCSSTSAITSVTANTAPVPTVTPDGPTTFCAPASVTLTSNYATGNTWSNGATTQSITIENSGSYTVTVTSANTCSAMAAQVVVTVTPSVFTGELTRRFVATGSMSEGGWQRTATRLPNGKVLVVGGFNGDSSRITSTELYDPATGVWSAAAPLPVSGSPLTATLLQNGKVLVTGFQQNGHPMARAELYDPSSNTWTTTGSMNAARNVHTATLLPNGKVLVYGGYNENQLSLASAELYDPATGVWTTTGSMSQALYYLNGALLPNNKVLVSGGYANVGPVTTTQIYDMASGTWSDVAPMNGARYQHGLHLLPSGKVLASGGSGIDGLTAELYNVSNNTWTMTGSLTNGRFEVSSASVELPNGKVLVIGGRNYNGDNPITTAEMYDEVSGKWTLAGNLPESRDAHTATVLQNGKVLVAGGLTASGFTPGAELYEEVADSIDPSITGIAAVCVDATTQLTAPPIAGGVWSSSNESIATVNTSGEVTGVAGGVVTINYTLVSSGGCVTTVGKTITVDRIVTITVGGPTTFCEPGSVTLTSNYATGNVWSNSATTQSITVENSGSYSVFVGSVKGCSDRSTPVEVTVTPSVFTEALKGTFAATGSMNEGGWQRTATRLPNGKVLVVGGFNEVSGRIATTELYDPATGVWSAAAPLQVTGRNLTATLLQNGKVLVTGFQQNGHPMARAELYDPSSNTWTTTGSMNAARNVHTATLLPNGKVLVYGGYNENQLSLASAELYDPATGVWTTTGSMSQALYYLNGALLPNNKVLVSGGYGDTGSVRTTRIYDMASGTWSDVAPMNDARSQHGLHLLPSGKVLASGGSGIDGLTAELYNVSNNTWTMTGSLTNGRFEVSSASVELPNGKVLVIGGRNYNGDNPITTAEMYDEVSGKWTLAGDLPESRDAHTATVLQNGKVLVAGGLTASGFTPSAELYEEGHAIDFAVTGTAGVCVNATTQLTAPPIAGGVWSSSNESIAKVNAAGMVTGVAGGVATINYTMVSSGGCATTVGKTITVNPSSTASISGAVNVCQNSASPAVTFTGANGTAPYTFTYTINSGAQQIVVSPGNTATVNAPTATAGTLTYTLVSVKDASSTACTNTASGAVAVKVNALPSANISGTTTVCRNATSPTVTFTGANATSPYTFTYTVNGGAQQTVTSVGNTATVTAPTTTVGIFVYALVSVKDASTALCTNTTTGSATVTVTAPTVPTFTQVAAICSGTGLSALPTTSVNGITGVWSPSLNNTATTTYTFTPTVGQCATTATMTIAVNLNVMPTFTQAAAICNGAGLAALPTKSDNGITGTWSPALNNTATTTYTFMADAGQCAATTTMTITVNPLPSATITAGGSTTFCAGGSVMLTASAGSSYLWSTHETTQSITVKESGNYSVIVTNSNSCSSTSSVTRVTVNQLPTATISGTAGVCLNTASPSITFTGANTTAPYTFTYTINGGAQQTIVSSGNTATITVPTTTAGTFSYALISVKDAGTASCSANAGGSAVVTVNGPPVVPAITGTTVVCAGTTTQLNNATAGGIWSSSNTAIATVDSRGTVTGIATGLATISYTAGTTGCATSVATSVSVATLPVATITALGTTTFCSGGSVMLKSTGSSLGNALNFNGSNQYVSVAPTSSINNLGLTGYTLEAWVYPTDVSGVKSILRKTSDYNLYIINGSVAAEVWPLGTSNSAWIKVEPNAANVIPNNTWTHVAATWNKATGTIKLYINGVEVSSHVTNGNIGGSEFLNIGFSTQFHQPFAGKLDEVRIWDTVRATSEIANNRNAFIASNTPHFAAYYKFDEGILTTTADATGHGNTGTLMNNPAWVIPSDVPVTYSNYSWTPGGGTTSGITANASGNYTLTVSDVNGCSATSSPITVTVNPRPTATVSGTTTTCVNAPAPTISFNGAGATAPYTFTYTINGGAQQTIASSGNTATITVPTTTAGTFTYTLVSVKDAAATSCTNTASGNAVVTVNSAPTFSQCPSNRSANSVSSQCSAIVNYTAAAIGSPSPSLTYTFSGATTGSGNGTGSGQSFNVGVTTVTITATNACGVVNCSFTVTILDITPPTISCPSNISVTATGAAGAVVNYTAPSGSDNCSGTTTVRTAGPASGSVFPIGVTVVAHTVSDAAGLTAQCSFTVTVSGLAPVVVCPSNITVNNTVDRCGAAVNYAATETTGMPASTITYSVEPGSFFGIGTHAVTATATNAVGVSNCTFYVTVTDIQHPAFSTITAISANNDAGKCGAAITMNIPAATDNCGAPVVTGVRSDGLLLSDDYPTGTTVITWTATDINHNTTSATQNIIVTDKEAPVPDLAILPTITGECSASVAVPTATDNCAGAIAGTTLDPTGYTAQGTYTITWSFDDGYGNVATQTQTVIVADITAPVPDMVTLPTITGECSVTISAVPSQNGAQPTGPVSAPAPPAPPTGPASAPAPPASSSAPPPSNSAPSSPASGSSPAQGNGTPSAYAPTAVDNCAGRVTATTTDPLTYTTQGTYIIHWSYDDGNGNVTMQTQTVIVKDTQAPVADMETLPTITAECNAGVTDFPTATDNCAGIIIGTTLDPTNYTVQGTYTITWKYDDGNGNVSTQTQTIVVQDVTAPVPDVEVLATITAECSINVTAPTATDNCAGLIIGTTLDPTSYTVQGIYTITWTYNDGNGNSSTQMQTVIVKDVTPPVANVATLPTITGECSATVTAPNATDNCSGTVIGTTTDPVHYNTQGTYIITWSYNDGNGNTSTQTQTVIVKDVTPPTIICPADINVIATSGAGAVVNYVAPVGTDNCSGATTARTGGLESGSLFPVGTTSVIHTVTDVAGLSAQCSFTVTVAGLAPVISCPGNISATSATGLCGAVVNFAATETRAIPASTITYSIAPGSFFPVGTTTITATATNAVGMSFCSFTITVIDNQFPVLTGVPANVTVECNAVPAIATVTATDNCVTSVPSFSETRTNGSCSGNYSLTRTWVTIDASGNRTTASQVITVQDTQKPILSAAPANVTVECNAVPAAAVLTATDNCSAPAVTFNEVRTNGASPFNYTLTRTWTATDACGNSCSKTQVITVRDTQAPVPTIAVLPTLTGDCSVTASAPTAQDNCAGLITATTVNPASYTAQGVYTITWSYNDGQGNTSTQTQRVVVKDQSGPIANAGALPTVTGQCSAVVTTKPTATDACSGVTAPGTTTDPLSYSAQGTYTIHWTYTDNFGNKTYQDQTVIVKDNIAPVPNLASLPTIEGQCSVNITMVNSTHCTDNCYCCRNVCHCRSSACNCNQWGEWLSNIFAYFFGNGNTGDDNHGCDHDEEVDDVNNLKMQAPTATDNCKGTIVGTTTDPLSYSTQGTYTIHWSFNDGNGNISIQNQTVTVADVEAPVPNAYSLPTVYGTCSATVTAKPTAKDNCKGTITGTTTDPLTYAGNGTYVIHWTFNDGNGNTSAQNQTVVINDNTKPTLTEPNDITISCSSSTLPAVTGNATASDNCGTPTITYTDATNGNKITRTWKATDAAGNYVTDVQLITIGSSFSAALTSVPTNNTYTGGVNTNLYLGFGAQSTTLQMCNLPSSGAPYSYAWSGTGSNKLNSTTTASPVFTPATFGYYSFTVVVTNKYGCTSSAYISICVTDVRVPGTSGAKVYVCHTPGGKNKTPQTLQVAISQVSSHIGSSSCGSNGDDRLGSCDQSPCNTTVTNSTIVSNTTQTTKEGGEAVATTEEDLKVTVMPNPTTTFFTLKLESKYETPVSMRVMDARGRVIDAKSKIGANSTIQIGHNYSSGTYYAELIQGNVRKVVQMVKGRG
jgi:nitrogen fixation protein FixH